MDSTRRRRVESIADGFKSTSTRTRQKVQEVEQDLRYSIWSDWIHIDDFLSAFELPGKTYVYAKGYTHIHSEEKAACWR